MSELLPCPFCGGVAVLVRPRIYCKTCGAVIEEHFSLEALIAAWNRRPAPSTYEQGVLAAARDYRAARRHPTEHSGHAQNELLIAAAVPEEAANAS